VLVGRVILYWVCALLYVGIGSACYQYNQNPEWTLAKHGQVLFSQIWPWLPTAIFLLPLAIYDVVRLSNLFAGPINRLRKHFDALRNDIACAPLTFREEDYWRDLAAPINDMQEEILRLRSRVTEWQKAAAPTSELRANLNAGPLNATEPAVRQDSLVEQPEEQAAADESAVAIALMPATAGFEAPLEAPAVASV
jgi:hypothetical protein